MQVSLMIAFAIHVCHLVHSIPDCPSLKSNNPPPLRDLGKRDTSLHGQRFHVSSVTILPSLRSSRRRHVCVCVCFQDIHKINASWHAKDQTAPQDFSFEFPCLLAGNSWVDGSSLVSESVALGDIWQNLLPRFAYKLPHPPAAMSQPPKNQHHMWLPLEFPHTHLLESGNEEAINILSIRPHRRPTVRLTNSCERTAGNSTATSLNLNLWLTLFSLAYLSISTNWEIGLSLTINIQQQYFCEFWGEVPCPGSIRNLCEVWNFGGKKKRCGR